MVSQLLEWCADIFGVTKRATARGRSLPFLVTLTAALCLSVLVGVRWGLWRGFVPVALVLVVAPYVAHRVLLAREELWRAACLELDDVNQPPAPRALVSLAPPTAIALGRLALAVDAVRRGDFESASGLLPIIDRALLQPDESRLLEAVRAMVSLGMGDESRAAQQAVLALPTGSEPLDTELGRRAVASAWGDARRLLAIDAAWDNEGVGLDQDGALSRLRNLVKLRLLGGDISMLAPAVARALAEEARAIGDDELATDLDIRGRAGGYR